MFTWMPSRKFSGGVRGEESRVCLQRLRGHSAEGMRVSFDDSSEDVAVWKSPIDLHETGVTVAYADGTSSHFNLWWRFAIVETTCTLPTRLASISEPCRPVARVRR